MYCLEDGTALVQGSVPSPDEPPTAILSEPPASAGSQSDEAKTRTFIHTTQAAAEPQDSLGDLTEKRSFSAHRAAKPLLVVAVLAVLILGGFFAYRYFSSSTKQIESIAVMPFVNESGNPDVEYL
jgi:hypothetical protein